MDVTSLTVSKANSRFRVPRTLEEESALVSEARPRSTKYKDKWAVEYQNTACFHLVFHWVSRRIHLSKIDIIYWLVTSGIINEFENKRSRTLNVGYTYSSEF